MNQTSKEIFHVAGDMPDPAGSGKRGVAPGYQLNKTAIGHPLLFYRLPTGVEIVLEADVYKLDNQPMYVHILCPLCAMLGRNNGLRIEQGHKEMHYDPDATLRRMPEGWSRDNLRRAFPDGVGGVFSCSQVQCAWEVTPELRRQTGFAVCPWRVVIDENIVRNV